MSILLEALKKSEAQRRLGETPTLQTPITAEDSSTEVKRYWVPAVMLVLTAALITWMGLVQFRPVAAPPELAALQTGESQAQAGQEPVDAPEPDGNQEMLVKTPVETGVENSAEAPAEAPAEALVKAPVKTPVTDYADAPPPPVSQGAPRTSPVASHEQAANLSRKSVSAIRQNPRGQKPSATVAATELTQDAIPADMAEGEQNEGDRLEPYMTEPLGYWQVPQSVRESMPELHITVLVYAENPQDRFLLINGERLREKEELSEGLILEEILRDHAIFSYRNYRFQVKS